MKVASQIIKMPERTWLSSEPHSLLIEPSALRSTGMAKIVKKSPKPETPNAEIAEEARPSKEVGSHGDKRILSIAIDPSLHSKLALLARCEGRSVTDLVVESVSKNLKARISAALESLKADLDT
jgi:hypothetical protein